MKKLNPYKVKAKIIEVGFELQFVANKIHMPQSALSGRLHGKIAFKADELGAIADICGCSVDEFYISPIAS